MPAGGLSLLRLLQLGASALPVGGIAHSFGLEALAAEGLLTPARVEPFLRDWLSEMGVLEASFCRAGHGLAREFTTAGWTALNLRLSAWKQARESRDASLAMGSRFLSLTAALTGSTEPRNGHYCAAFGLVSGGLKLDIEDTVLAYLHQSVAGLVSACQRLMPVGQSEAARIVWNLKPAIIEAAGGRANAACFTPLPDAASMSHVALTTRLFMS